MTAGNPHNDPRKSVQPYRPDARQGRYGRIENWRTAEEQKAEQIRQQKKMISQQHAARQQAAKQQAAAQQASRQQPPQQARGGVQSQAKGAPTGAVTSQQKTPVRQAGAAQQQRGAQAQRKQPAEINPWQQGKFGRVENWREAERRNKAAQAKMASSGARQTKLTPTQQQAQQQAQRRAQGQVPQTVAQQQQLRQQQLQQQRQQQAQRQQAQQQQAERLAQQQSQRQQAQRHQAERIAQQQAQRTQAGQRAAQEAQRAASRLTPEQAELQRQAREARAKAQQQAQARRLQQARAAAQQTAGARETAAVPNEAVEGVEHVSYPAYEQRQGMTAAAKEQKPKQPVFSNPATRAAQGKYDRRPNVAYPHSSHEEKNKGGRQIPWKVIVPFVLIIVIVLAVRVIDPFAGTGSNSGDQAQAGAGGTASTASYFPTPIMSESSGVQMHSAVAMNDLTEILIHNASYAYAGEITTRLEEATNTEVIAAHGTGRVPSTQPTGDNWMTGEFIRCFRSGNAGPVMSAIDCGGPVGATVYAPVTGTVVMVKQYKLYDQIDDYRIHIQPEGRPDLDCVLIHLTDVEVQPGDEVIGGVTPIAKIRDVYQFLGESLQLRSYTSASDNGNHTHIQMNNANHPEYTALDELKEPDPEPAPTSSQSTLP